MINLSKISNKELVAEVNRRVKEHEVKQELADTIENMRPWFDLMLPKV